VVVGAVVGGVVVGGGVVGFVVVGFVVGWVAGWVVWVAGGLVVWVASTGGVVVGAFWVGAAVGVGSVAVTLGASDWDGATDTESEGSGASVVGSGVSDAGGATAMPSPQLSVLWPALAGALPTVTVPVDTVTAAGSTQNQDAAVVLTGLCARVTVSPSGR
jgi:hypothetical protein